MNIYVEIPTGLIRDTFLTSENVALLEELGDVHWNPSCGCGYLCLLLGHYAF